LAGTDTHVVSNKPGHRNGMHNRILSRTGVQRGLLLVLFALSVLLQGCFLDRLSTLRNQTCSFNEHFDIRIDPNFVIDLHDPVLLQKDMHLIWGAAPTSISSSDTGSTMHYLFQRVPGTTDNGSDSLLKEFSLEFDFIPADGQLRLSKISSNDLPVELLLTSTNMGLSGMDEIAEFACQVELNPFTRSMTLPLDRNWFSDLPAKNELVAIFGKPNSTLDDGNKLIYEYRLKGSDDEPQVASFVIRYDETGEKPLTLEADFNRYQMHTDILTALMKVQFSI